MAESRCPAGKVAIRKKGGRWISAGAEAGRFCAGARGCRGPGGEEAARDSSGPCCPRWRHCLHHPPTSAPAGSTYVGKRLSNFANTHFTGQLKYQATEAFSFGGTATYKSATYTGQPDTAAGYNFDLEVYSYKIPAYWTFDAFVAYKFNENLSARLNVNNIGNKDYYVAGYRSGHFLYKGDERRATLTLTGRF